MVTAEYIEEVHSFQRGREKTYSSRGTLEMQEGEDDWVLECQHSSHNIQFLLQIIWAQALLVY
jgi:hypothetical protein